MVVRLYWKNCRFFGSGIDPLLMILASSLPDGDIEAVGSLVAKGSQATKGCDSGYEYLKSMGLI